MQDDLYDLIVPRDWPSSAPSPTYYPPPPPTDSFPPTSSPSPPSSIPVSSPSAISSSMSSSSSSSSTSTLTSASTVSGSLFPTDGAQSAPATTSALLVSPTALADFQVAPVCIGRGVDTQSLGLISALVVPAVVGLLIWLIFGVVRRRYRQVYALREWFVPQGLRPPPLGRSFWAFLSPPIPLVPDVPEDVNDAGRSAARDAELFPSDEQLSQRVLWTCLLIALGWSVLSLGGLLPLYMVNTPCLASTLPPAPETGAYSALQDLSLLRLLRLIDPNPTPSSYTAALALRDLVPEQNDSQVRTRLIILTVLAIVLGVLPAFVLIIREFNQIVTYRERWLELRCGGLEMGWLSASSAPGLVGWGERRIKDFIVKVGLSASLDPPENANGNGNGNHVSSRRRKRELERVEQRRAELEIDVRSLFSIGDTSHLALLIDERDEILEKLEVAETKYIDSFKLTTPDPSVVDLPVAPMPVSDMPPPVPPKPEISRPRPLASHSQRRRQAARNPAFGSSSLPPSSFVMPSQYYKIRYVGGEPEEEDVEGQPATVRRRGASFTESVNQRVVGSAFQEVNRDSVAYGRLPMGSQVVIEKNGQMGPAYLSESPLPDTAPYGPQASHTSWDTAAFHQDMPPAQWWTHQPGDSIQEEPEEHELPLGEDWVDVLTEAPEAVQHGDDYNPDATPARRRPRPPRAKHLGQDDRRDTFPLRHKETEGQEQRPPHLRVQVHGPFVRPISGLNHEDLGQIYNDINIWRARLKTLNAEISDMQRECYNDIADGARIKGWLMVGRGLRFLPGVEMIDGRAKEDIRWDELQHEGGRMRMVAFWFAVCIITIMLGIGMTAAAGLSVASAPAFAHYFPFFLPLSSGNFLGAGVAVCLGAAVGAALFMAVAVVFVHHLGPMISSVSLIRCRFITFKAIFYAILCVGSIWLFTLAAILFAFAAFDNNMMETLTVATGAIYAGVFAMALILTVATVAPALLLLQPARLWRVLREEKHALTPRQRFRAVYPEVYNPAYAMSCCVVAMLLSSAFTLLFPLVAPAAVVLVFLTLLAHRFLIGYVYGRTQGQTGGLQQIWLLKRLGTLVAFQPLVLGLIFLSRRIWIEGGVLCGAASFVLVFVEFYCTWRTRLPGRRSLAPPTRESLDNFARASRLDANRDVLDEERTSLVSSQRSPPRGSFASILEMMSLTLAVMPYPSQMRGPLPLETETLDDLTATERAARTHPDAPPHLPPLPFADHAEEMAGILYAPELLAPSPMIWLPNDLGGVGRSEAYDLQKYHGLQVTVDVRSMNDVYTQHMGMPEPNFA